ncbi:vitamin K epoxide reductase family protein [Blastococcus sp. KM273128]|uniref:vitamin K epoxide reductase family protein n=1 Tax=Blastococcus sp. KM273128 TaxID=2570314 RepID=UPI001F1B81B4|nr:vitamin K epoxide reductase family protein [Blastococcus sp. KM273128]MCF6746335.1 vitamin K epoxide reductase family protein [Blastococcus sp. KM273128]
MLPSPAESVDARFPAELRRISTSHEGRNGPPPADRAIAWLLLIGGLLGLAASFVLAVEKYALLADPGYVPTCSLNPVLSCGSVMSSPQAALFGFPNPLVGVAGFPVVVVTGAVLLAGARLPGWFWSGLQLGVTGAVVLVHWLIFSSIYRIGALCPYCLVVWAVTIPVFWYVTLRNLAAIHPRSPSPLARVVEAVRSVHGIVLTVWFLLITAAIAQRFWLYWSTLVD